MAERRMLHRKAAVSSDLADLRRRHGGDAVAFFHQLIPFYDRWGCVPDDARTLRGMACPTWEDVAAKDVKGWIEWMVRRGILVRITGPSGAKGLRNPSFPEHQYGTKFDREAPSPFEPEAITKQWARTDKERWRSAGESGPGPDHIPTRSGPGPPKGREGKGINPSLSLTTEESAAATSEPSPLAQSPPPGVEDYSNGNGGVDLEAIAADVSPLVAAAIRRTRARILEEG